MPHKVFPPAGACDCHVHVVGPKADYPLTASRSYTPGDAPVASLRAMMERLGVARTVIVQPSFFGFDNSCMLDALDALGKQARGVAVLPPEVSAETLDHFHSRGIRAIRVNAASFATSSADVLWRLFTDAAALAERNGWHVQTFIKAADVARLADRLRQLPVPLVIDHFALIPLAAPESPEARAVFELLESGNVWLKLSAPYRIAADPGDPRITALARRLAEINPERVIWGTDWPHTPAHGTSHADPEKKIPYRDIDTRRLLDLVAEWFPEPSMQSRVLVDNPQRLFGFGSA